VQCDKQIMQHTQFNKPIYIAVDCVHNRKDRGVKVQQKASWEMHNSYVDRGRNACMPAICMPQPWTVLDIFRIKSCFSYFSFSFSKFS
jgi:hypothetical protein